MAEEVDIEKEIEEVAEVLAAHCPGIIQELEENIAKITENAEHQLVKVKDYLMHPTVKAIIAKNEGE